MSTPNLQTTRLELLLQTPDEVRAQLEKMAPHEKAELSPAWLALVEKSVSADPWVHGFVVVARMSGGVIGSCGFKGPPDVDGTVEIAYGVAPEHQGQGYATEAAAALADFAFGDERVRLVRAHTRPEANASGRVLTKCGFERVREVIDPEDGLVWRWDKRFPVISAEGKA
jgi:ribosomal-protein-alanine N-acetyltransferase